VPVVTISDPESPRIDIIVPVSPLHDSNPVADTIPQVRKSARQKARRERRNSLPAEAHYAEATEFSYFADWTTHKDDNYYWSFCDFKFLTMGSTITSSVDSSEMGLAAVTENVPRSFSDALKDPLWGDAARTELNTLISTKAIVEIDAELARNTIKSQGADLVLLFPVYEKKVKEGKVVHKVRLVGDGRTHYHAGDTYSATPSREELLILLHVAAGLGWHYVHLDEKRAFLKAPYQGENRAFTKLKDDNQFYEILGALYGLKTAPRDYQAFVSSRLLALGFRRLMLCSCIYVYIQGTSIVLLYDYVDDFIVFGSDLPTLELWVMEFRKTFDTTEPVWNSDHFLGLEIYRDWDRRLVKITMTSKILETCARFGVSTSSKKHDMPMPSSGYVVKESEFDSMTSESSRYLSKAEILQYLAVVGSLLWISGIRHDILFAVLYLTWSTKTPRYHHMLMAKYVLSYLYFSNDLPLVLGGSADINLNGYTDASLGTAPKGRSVIGSIEKLHPDAGAVCAKCRATSLVHLASFEAELDGVMVSMKRVRRVRNVLDELGIVLASVPLLWSDNKAMINFVHGEGVAKGVRHMELRMWYVREQYSTGGIILNYMPGVSIPTDKLGTKESHAVFTCEIMGLNLLK
jgi:Reverse transcriptase (RNA-dependent DNA polymerase)